MNPFNSNDGDDSNIFDVIKKDIPGFGTSRGTTNNRRNAKVISKMACGHDVIVIGTIDNYISKWSPTMDANSEYEPIELPRRADESIENIFIDPSGFHCIVTMTNGDNYYIFTRSHQRYKKISRFQGNVESVAFDKNGGTETQTRSFLVATSIGYIYELCLESSGKEKINQQVFQLDQPLAITSLHFEYIGSSTDERYAGMVSDAKIFVLCATSSPTRLYTFYGGPNFQQLFLDQVQRGPASYNDLPGDIKRAELHFYSDKQRTRNDPQNRQTFALMTDIGIYYGSAVFPSATSSKSDYSDVLAEWQLMPYVASMETVNDSEAATNAAPSVPISIAVTAHHFLTLTVDRLQALSKLNGELVWEIDAKLLALKPSGPVVNPGVPVCLVRDKFNNNIWMCSDASIYQITCTNEDRNVWLVYLKRALAASEDKLFDQAVEHCKADEQRLHVMCSQAEMYIDQGNHVQASRVLAKAGISFDDAALRLLNVTSSTTSKDGFLRPEQSSSQGMPSTSRHGSSKPVPTGPGASYVNGPALTALRVYINETLAAQPITAKSQRTMLSTWLCELYLHQITCASLFPATLQSSSGAGSAAARVGVTSSGGVLQTEAELVSAFKQFLRTYKTCLDQATTLHQLSSRSSMRCHRNLLHFYAQIVGDYDRVLTQLLGDKRFSDAISLLDEAPIERVESLIIKCAPQLIEFEPEALVTLLTNKPRIKPSSVLPAMLRYSSLLDKLYNDDRTYGTVGSRDAGRLDVDCDGNIVNFAIQYLSSCVEKLESSHSVLQHAASGLSHPEVAAYHSLLWMLAKYDSADELQLTGFLQQQCDRVADGLPLIPGVDLDFVLRQCRRYSRRKSLVLACLLMGQFQQAVDDALVVDINLAKDIANRPSNAEDRKALWLSIAQYTIQQDKGAKRALAILADSGGALRIEDLLPHLPDFTEIDQFKDQICKTLEDCSAHIEHLRLEMTELSDSAEGIVKELESMKKRGYASSVQQRCEYCNDSLFCRQFYLFPCSHGMHSDCLLKRTHQYRHLEASQLAAVKSLEEQLRVIAIRVKDNDKRAMAQQDNLQSELDSYIAGDCPLCGNIMIKSLSCPLIGEQDTDEAKSWEL